VIGGGSIILSAGGETFIKGDVRKYMQSTGLRSMALLALGYPLTSSVIPLLSTG
jgi:hypothetical protein